MAENKVTLTFAGDSEKLERSFDSVGAGSKKMASTVGESGKSFDEFGEKIGNQEAGWQGLSGSITGTADVASGAALIFKGNVFEGSVLAAGGLADLAQGFQDTIVPVAKAVAGFVAHNAAMVAHATWSGIVKVATLAWTGVQWLLNAALTANPIGLIIVGIAALVAVVVLIATKTTWFQDIWRAAWGGIKSVASAVFDWLGGLPGRIGDTFSSVTNAVSAPFKAGFNMISRAWNNTIGRLSWTFPAIFGVGGFTIRAPQLPTFHGGGVVPGLHGQDVMAILRAGEHVVTEKDAAAAGGIGGTTNIYVTISLEDLAQLRDLEEFMDLLRNNSRRGLAVSN